MSKAEGTAAPLASALNELIGKRLSSIEFVQDYLQLHFDGATLTAYSRPVLQSGPRELVWEDPGYGDAFRSLIGAEVRCARVTDSEIGIDFNEGERVLLSLRDEDYRGPEAFELRLSPTSPWIVG